MCLSQLALSTMLLHSTCTLIYTLKWYCSIGCSCSIYIPAVQWMCQSPCSHSDHSVFSWPVKFFSQNSPSCFITSSLQHSAHVCIVIGIHTTFNLKTAHKQTVHCSEVSTVSQMPPLVTLININKLLFSPPQNLKTEQLLVISLVNELVNQDWKWATFSPFIDRQVQAPSFSAESEPVL